MMSLNENGVVCRMVEDTKDGKLCFTVETENDMEHFSALSKQAQSIVLCWLRWNIFPAKTPLDEHTTYGMKHILENRTGIYLTNNQMKEAMLKVGFMPVKVNEFNWWYRIKKSSPIFQTQVDGRPGMPMLGNPLSYHGYR